MVNSTLAISARFYCLEYNKTEKMDPVETVRITQCIDLVVW